MTSDEKILLTADTRMSPKEEQLLTEGKLVPVTVDELVELAHRAIEVKLQFDVVARAGMTLARAVQIRELRKTSSWRLVAAMTFRDWGEDAMWSPQSNQLAGIALCEAAAELLGEDPKKYPWQAAA